MFEKIIALFSCHVKYFYLARKPPERQLWGLSIALHLINKHCFFIFRQFKNPGGILCRQVQAAMGASRLIICRAPGTPGLPGRCMETGSRPCNADPVLYRRPVILSYEYRCRLLLLDKIDPCPCFTSRHRPS